MPRSDVDEVFSGGVLVSSTPVVRGMRVVTDAELATAKQNLRSFWQTFQTGGVPTGTPTNAQLRNAILSLIVATRWLVNELDDET